MTELKLQFTVQKPYLSCTGPLCSPSLYPLSETDVLTPFSLSSLKAHFSLIGQLLRSPLTGRTLCAMSRGHRSHRPDAARPHQLLFKNTTLFTDFVETGLYLRQKIFSGLLRDDLWLLCLSFQLFMLQSFLTARQIRPTLLLATH